MRFLFALAIFLGLSACSTLNSNSVADEPLFDRYWRVFEVDGKPVGANDNRPEPHLVLDAGNRVHGSDGCNRFNGSYDTTQGLRFGRMASTMMACVPPTDLLAREVIMAFNVTTSYRIQGKQLELFDAEGRSRVRLEATFLK